MALRVIVRTDNAGMACNVGGAVLTDHTTFVIEDAALEAYLSASLGSYAHRQVVGVEIVGPANDQEP